MDSRPVVSFCATNLNTMDRLPSSLASIERVGEGLSLPFEVVVADGPSDDGARALLETRARANPRFHVVTHGERNRGYGRRRAFEASRGTTIVPFDTSLVYEPLYGGLIAGYVSLGTDRMLFSEVCALSRRSIEAVGGWRDLIGGEDIDLYSRVIREYGVIAWPTAASGSQSARLGSVARQMRYVGGSRSHRLRRVYAVQRDQMIGCNFRVRDLMLFNSGKPVSTRIALWMFFGICAIGERFRGIPPIRAEKNNYLIFREALLRSLQAEDYRKIPWAGPPPRLLLTDDEIRYLSRASLLWSEMGTEVERYVGRKE
jgi:glycosyltransferase involved in cell wall biosynthesis